MKNFVQPIVGLLLATIVPASAAGLPPAIPVAVKVLSVDQATHAQSRHAERLIAATGEPGAWFDLRPFAADGVDQCIERRHGSIARGCARSVLSKLWIGGMKPVHVVVMIEPAEDGTARATCIGVGTEPKSPERQNILVEPDSFYTRGHSRWLADVAAMASCITAAGSESGW